MSAENVALLREAAKEMRKGSNPRWPAWEKVADWIDTAGADLWAHGPLHCAEGCHECDDDLWMHHARRALTVARTYLGRAS